MSYDIDGRAASDSSILKEVLFDKKRNLNIGHFNGQSINPNARPDKFDEIKEILKDCYLDVIGVSETWLKSSTTNKMVAVPGYKLVRNDRLVRRGGGVAFYISDKLRTRVIDRSPANSSIEYLFIEVSLGNIKVAVGVIYRPNGHLDDISELLSEISARYVNIVMMGDFNLNLLDNAVFTNSTSFFQNFNLEIFTNSYKPTHFDITHRSLSLLDFFVINNSELIDRSGQFWIPGVSKHALIFVSLFFQNNNTPHSFEYRDFNNINMEDLLAECYQFNMTQLHSLDNIDSQVNFLNSFISDIYNRYVPLRLHLPKMERCLWDSPLIKNAKSLRDEAFRIYKRNQSEINWRAFTKLRNYVTQLNKKAKAAFGKQHFDNISCSKDFWKKINKFGVSEDSGGLSHFDTNNLDNLNSYFVSLHDSNPSTRIDTSIVEKSDAFSFRNVLIDEVGNALSQLKSNAEGLDHINLKFIKIIFPALNLYFLHIINYILSSSKFPLSWKLAKIIPIPKKTNPSDFSDYRPISVLPCLSKLCEKLMKDQIMVFLDSDDRVEIYKLQSGFRANYSTTTALLNITEKIRENIDKKKASLLLFLDFSKAFNRIDHGILCRKLKEQFYFSNSACNLIFSYLTDRAQGVAVGNHISEFKQVFSGVPQGSILGPLLFTLYINDLWSVVKNSLVHIFADDVQLLLDCDPKFPIIGVNLMNDDIKNVEEWAHLNRLSLNGGKTQAMAVYRKSVKDSFPPILLNGIPIPYVSTVKNLGLHISDDLSWDKHISYLCKKIFLILKRLYLIKHFLPLNTRLQLVKSLIVPQLLYCCEIFSGCSVACRDRLKISFHSALRFIYSLKRRDHISHLAPSVIGSDLNTFFKIRVLILLFKVIKYHCPSYLFEKIIFGQSSRSLCILFPPFSSLAMDQSFLVRATRLWNKLPNCIKGFTAMSKFKSECLKFFVG